MYKPNIRVKFIWRLYRIRNTVKFKEGRKLSFTDMVEEALSSYLYHKEHEVDRGYRELPEVKIGGKWYYLDERMQERRTVPLQEKRIND